ncbi:MAG: hypothetical protein RQM92_12315 [Candidatus Syntrophopropionicum ammoniitolerans]
MEQQLLMETFSYHVGKVENPSIRQLVVDMFANVDQGLAVQMAANVGGQPPQGTHVAVTAASPSSVKPILSIARPRRRWGFCLVMVLMGQR